MLSIVSSLRSYLLQPIYKCPTTIISKPSNFRAIIRFPLYVVLSLARWGIDAASTLLFCDIATVVQWAG
jgi:hypothetical protein